MPKPQALSPNPGRLIKGSRMDARVLASLTEEACELTGITLDPAQVEVFHFSPLARRCSNFAELMGRWWVAAQRCESPIEKLMCWAMLGEGLAFEQQVKLGDFVADFVLHPKPQTSNLKPVVVECDGHEHHTSRERQARDRRIDRELQKQGYAILRFTGSQITTDPNACAREVAEFIKARKPEPAALTEKQHA